MVHVLPRWLATTMEVDIDGEVLVMGVEAMAQEAMEGLEAMLVAEATAAAAVAAAAAMLVAPTPTAEAMAEATEEVLAVAIEVAPEETSEGRVEEATEERGDSSEGVLEGAMGVVILDKEGGEVVAIKTCYVSAYA